MDSTFLQRSILEGRGKPWSLPARAALRVCEAAYKAGVRWRNRRFDRSTAVVRLAAPVISVGNITVGGTGKTPMVMELTARLYAMGRRPAVVARGYKARFGSPNDEERLIRRYFPDLVYIVDRDRARGAARAMECHGADVILLDDGFQHRRLGRDLDLVLIDAVCPFGSGYLLPRGLLREPLDGLRRASALIITRTDQVSPSQLSDIEGRLASLNSDAVLLKCRHRAVGLEDLEGSPFGEPLSGKRVFLFASLGQPQAFAQTVASLGAEAVGLRWWPDHHEYGVADVKVMMADRRWGASQFGITTEKDAVKLRDLRLSTSRRILVVKVAIDFSTADATMLDSLLKWALSRSEKPCPVNTSRST